MSMGTVKWFDSKKGFGFLLNDLQILCSRCLAGVRQYPVPRLCLFPLGAARELHRAERGVQKIKQL